MSTTEWEFLTTLNERLRRLRDPAAIHDVTVALLAEHPNVALLIGARLWELADDACKGRDAMQRSDANGAVECFGVAVAERKEGLKVGQPLRRAAACVPVAGQLERQAQADLYLMLADGPAQC